MTNKNKMSVDQLENVHEPLIEITIKEERTADFLYNGHMHAKFKDELTNQNGLNFENVHVKQEYPVTWIDYKNVESDFIPNKKIKLKNLKKHKLKTSTNGAESFFEISVTLEQEVKYETIQDNRSKINLIPTDNVKSHRNKNHSSISDKRFSGSINKTDLHQNKISKTSHEGDLNKSEPHLHRSVKNSTHIKKCMKRRRRTQTVFESNSFVKPYNCNICGKKYALKYNFNRHIDTHDDEKRFICDICQNKFGRKSHLVSHMKIHTGERPFPCNICHNRFAHKSTLTSHMMTHTGEKPYICKICHNKFAQKSTLVGHMKIHTGEKPFACGLCESKFAHKSTLVSHMKTHTGERPYSCNICENTFSLKSTLSRHMKTHIGEKPFSCYICHIKFGLKLHLEKHLQTHTDSE